MNFKKTITTMTAVVLLFGGVGMPAIIPDETATLTAHAETTGTYEHLTYTLYDDHATITGFDNTVADVVIPSEISMLPVTEIGQDAFLNATRLKTVKIPETVTKIGISAFNTATSLSEITLPSNLQSIGNYAFHKCISLKEITLPESLNSLGDYAFYGCVSMQTANVAGSITKFPASVFSGCTSLIAISIPLSITDLNNRYDYGAKSQSLSGCPIQDVYYEGSQMQWNAISLKYLDSATIHYGLANPPKRITPDINEDGTINAVDASILLQYSAYVGANDYIEIADFLEMLAEQS